MAACGSTSPSRLNDDCRTLRLDIRASRHPPSTVFGSAWAAANARLKDQPELMPNAIEELLRYDSPVQLGGRTALEEVDVGGTTVPRSGMVLLMLGAANRDPLVFDDPEVFDEVHRG